VVSGRESKNESSVAGLSFPCAAFARYAASRRVINMTPDGTLEGEVTAVLIYFDLSPNLVIKYFTRT
jgi:hypothetical protein